MTYRTMHAFTAGVAMAAALTMTVSAVALWAANRDVPAAAIGVGALSMDAFGQSGTTTPQYSDDGGPVTLVLPGADIIGVMGQTGIDPPPVIWRFTVQGYANGIAGLDVDVTVDKQIAQDGKTTDLSSGVADPGTLLAFSTMTVYPASVNGDCSAVPVVTPAPGKNVYLIDNSERVLQAPGAFSGAPVQQYWCVAMDFNNRPDATYGNEVQAQGIADDSTVHNAIASWQTVVEFPPSLDPIGPYVNQADVVGTAEDGTYSRDTDIYQAMIYPDPNQEPDVTIIVQPRVTSLGSGAPTSPSPQR